MIGCCRSARTLRPEHWPAADRAMWAALVTDAGLYAPAGPFARLRPGTRESYAMAYGVWLGWLAAQGVDLDATLPPARATPNHLAGIVADHSDLAPRTLANRLEALLRVLGAAAPDTDLPHLREVASRARRRANAAERTRERPPLPEADALLALARSLLAAACARPATDRRRAIAIRDAVLMLFLIRHPIRLGNLAELTLGGSYRIGPHGHRVLIAADAAKGHAEISFAVHAEVADAVNLWLREGRPGLLPPSATIDALWLSQKRRPLGASSIRPRLAPLTEAHLGTWVTPHHYRHLARTGMVRAGVTDPALLRGILAHRDDTTGDRYYNQATSAEALSGYSDLLARLSRKGARP